MEVKNLCQEGNTLQATFRYLQANNNEYKSRFDTILSPKYVISGAAEFQVKVNVTQILPEQTAVTPLRQPSQRNTFGFLEPTVPAPIFGNPLMENQLIFIKFTKLLQEDDLSYTIKLTSNELGVVNKNFISDDGTWHVIYDNRNIKSSFDVTVHMDTVTSACPFAMLHEDTELTDFELRGEDGSVRMHRAVLAAASPVLKRMLSGTWREAREGRVDVPGTSKVTLQNLKDYVYLHTLPDNGLEPLLLLASCYMMKDLEQNCIYKIVSSITAENACDLLEFATRHKVPLLLLAILECAKSEKFKLDELRKHLLGSI